MSSHLGLNGSQAAVSLAQGLLWAFWHGQSRVSLSISPLGDGARAENYREGLAPPASQVAEQGWGRLCAWGRTDLATRTVWRVPSQPLPRTVRGGLMSPPDTGSHLAAGR